MKKDAAMDSATATHPTIDVQPLLFDRSWYCSDPSLITKDAIAKPAVVIVCRFSMEKKRNKIYFVS